MGTEDVQQLTLADGGTLELARPVIAGVLNVTPDSFSDGGMFIDAGLAVEAAQRMVKDGADVIDVGGESTRPGAERVDPEEQIARVIPVIEQLADEGDFVISVDTTSARVAEAALDAGAGIINDVSAGLEDEMMLDLVADRGAPIILMHKQGDPKSMQKNPSYQDVVMEVKAHLLTRVDAFMEAGAREDQFVLDPGIGFGKTVEHNLQLIAHLDELVITGFPVMLGTSRKSFIGRITGVEDPIDRDAATCGTTAIGVEQGVQIFRVHNVGANRQAADLAFALHVSRRG